MALPFWDGSGAAVALQRDPWDVVTVGGIALPGIAKVKARRKAKLDAKTPVGGDGATLTDRGDTAAEVDITLTIWTADHLRELEAAFGRMRLKKRTPVDVVHPQLQILGIRSLYVSELGSPEAGGSPGTREVAIKLVEFRPPAKKDTTKTPTASADIASLATPSGANYTTNDGRQIAKPSGAVEP